MPVIYQLYKGNPLWRSVRNGEHSPSTNLETDIRNRNLPLESLRGVDPFAELSNPHQVEWLLAGQNPHKWPHTHLDFVDAWTKAHRWHYRPPPILYHSHFFTSFSHLWEPSGPSCPLEAKALIFHRGLENSFLAQFFNRVPKVSFAIVSSFTSARWGQGVLQIQTWVLIHT